MVRTVSLEHGGVKVVLISTGAAILSIHTPDRNGMLDDIVLGHPTVEEYTNDASGSYFGCVVGRVANRINQAVFTIPSGPVVTLEANNPPHALHGGSKHWGRREWDVDHEEGSSTICFTLRSPDGDAGYPGQVEAKVKYSLEPGKARQDQGSDEPLPTLRIIMEASTDSCTPVNMVQHTHWNLSGSKLVVKGSTVGTHELKLIGCNYYTPVDSTLIPTGDVKSVSDTPLDFSSGPVLEERLNQVKNGIDHNFVTDYCCNEWNSGALDIASEPGGMKPVQMCTVPVAELRDPETGRGLVLSSNAPGLQVYTGNFLEGVCGKDGVRYKKHQSICLESQSFPNAVNIDTFPSPFLRPGEVYLHRMDVKFFSFGLE